MIYAAPIRPSSFGIADIYPEAKGPYPSTAQLGNPAEVRAAAGSLGGAPLSGPNLNPRELVNAPAVWLLVALGLLLFLSAKA